MRLIFLWRLSFRFVYRHKVVQYHRSPVSYNTTLSGITPCPAFPHSLPHYPIPVPFFSSSSHSSQWDYSIAADLVWAHRTTFSRSPSGPLFLEKRDRNNPTFPYICFLSIICCTRNETKVIRVCWILNSADLHPSAEVLQRGEQWQEQNVPSLNWACIILSFFVSYGACIKMGGGNGAVHFSVGKDPWQKNKNKTGFTTSGQGQDPQKVTDFDHFFFTGKCLFFLDFTQSGGEGNKLGARQFPLAHPWRRHCLVGGWYAVRR